MHCAGSDIASGPGHLCHLFAVMISPVCFCMEGLTSEYANTALSKNHSKNQICHESDLICHGFNLTDADSARQPQTSLSSHNKKSHHAADRSIIIRV